MRLLIFGTDDWYLPYLARFVKPGGVVAIAGSGFVSEIDDIPDHLSDWIRTEPSILSLHSAAWWKKHWERTAVVDVEIADQMVDGWRYWLDWQKCIAPENRMEIQSLEADQGSNLTYLCVVGRRRTGIELEEPIMSIPAKLSANDSASLFDLSYVMDRRTDRRSESTGR